MTLAEKNKQNKQKRLDLLNIAIKNEALLSSKMANFDNGINQVISDTRSLYEKRNDANFLKKDFQKKCFLYLIMTPKTQMNLLIILAKIKTKMTFYCLILFILS